MQDAKISQFNTYWLPANVVLLPLIIKITISSIVIGLKNSYFPLFHLPSCYRTVCYRTACYRTVCYRTACYRTVCYRTVQQTNHIQSCSLNLNLGFNHYRNSVQTPKFMHPLSVF